jgi:diaminopimelate decarboxylase
MPHFYGTATRNEQDHLVIGGVDVVDLAAEFGTPLYIMDEALIRANCRAYRTAFESAYPNVTIAYASKAFLVTAMVALVEQEGCALDVVSGGEIYTARAAGYPMAKTFFHGNNKTRAEIEYALESGVGRFISDTEQELRLINQVAGEMGVKASVMLRLSPGVGAHTHEYITTGQLDSKFGFPIETGAALAAARLALSLEHVVLTGFHCHIGSQIFELTGFGLAAERMIDFLAQVRDELGFTAIDLNLGGGLGVRYTKEDTPATPGALAAVVIPAVKKGLERHGLPFPRLIFEPGRSIVAEAGTTLYTVGTIKEIPGIRTYVAVDGGMGDNIRPALYQAEYEGVIANKLSEPATKTVTVVGRYCESGDKLLIDTKLAPSVAPGDLLAVFATGAYNYTMASHYNRFAKPQVIFVRDGQAYPVTRRERYEDLAAFDLLPTHLKAKVRS